MEDHRVRSDADSEQLFSQTGIPTIRRMTTLPMWATVAFAARCARRIQPFIHLYWPDMPAVHKGAVETCLRAAELRADSLDPVDIDAVIHQISDAGNEANQLRSKSGHLIANRCSRAISTVLVTAYAIKSALRRNKWYAADNASDSANCACRSVEANYQIVDDIRADLHDITQAADSAGWDDNSVEPLHFFPSTQQFTFVNYNDLERRFIALANAIDVRLIDYLAQHPYELRAMHDRSFEQLIAELLAGLGFSVRLTAQTRDGGYDVFAVEDRADGERYLIECKRYASQKVAVGVVRNLLGAVRDTASPADKGIIATTDFLTADAHKFVERNSKHLDARDFYGVQDWLRQYQKRQDQRRCHRTTDRS